MQKMTLRDERIAEVERYTCFATNRRMERYKGTEQR